MKIFEAQTTITLNKSVETEANGSSNISVSRQKDLSPATEEKERAVILKVVNEKPL